MVPYAMLIVGLIVSEKDGFSLGNIFILCPKIKKAMSDLVAPIDIACYLRPKSKCSNFGPNISIGAPKSDSNRLVQYWFFERLAIIQKCS